MATVGGRATGDAATAKGDQSNERERGQVKGRLVIAASGPHFSLHCATWWVPGSVTWYCAAVRNRQAVRGDVACWEVWCDGVAAEWPEW